MFDALIALQLETGLSIEHPPTDDTYVERRLPGGDHEHYDSFAFGASLRFAPGAWRIHAGWRNLGNVHTNSPIISDGAYAACAPRGCPGAKPIMYWWSGGDTQQTYLEVGRSFHLAGSWRWTPTVGDALTRIRWHSAFYNEPCLTFGRMQVSKPQDHGGLYAGVAFERGPVQLGAFYMYTSPTENLLIDGGYPGQGHTTLLLQLAYSIPLVR
jgi:hypothetical protein